jgi:hypothetical protein
VFMALAQVYECLHCLVGICRNILFATPIDDLVCVR